MSAGVEFLSETSPISRKSAAESVFEDLRLAIVSGRLSIGTRLPAETHLAGKYGVSRPIVREALRSLQTLGMTQTRTGSGTFVLTDRPSPELSYGGYSARDLIEARPYIEVPAAGWAAVRRTGEQLTGILKLCDAMDAQEDAQKWVKLDSEFHGAIADASGNSVFAKVLSDARDSLSQQSGLLNVMADRRAASNIEHRLIAEAIAAGSDEAARSAMEAHLGRVKQIITSIMTDRRPLG
ncbi:MULTISPECIES: FadR/GntR family transcriptional regulator [unclassified Rhizobium]|uniref:FadR/GntR family transcriptional regulator n=1 Tax=unclassified Rhizobium TaxID=2613769 RepID=UPI00177E75D7|nr:MULTISPECIES: FadR/GntR family transcriptional regulator [unclassified Rhizobium]MBD8689720.1 FadR family transcriptional regulator [Rhizobium sp. CFBP 13644]MBD8694275.1 FadR family transcriptional regulator [Rhizobium sp. CFBP 13717]